MGCKVIANKQTWRTKHIMKNLNPQWNEETSFVFFNAVEEIQFEVYDWDNGSKHDIIGCATLETKDFYDKNNKGFKDMIKLEKCKKGSIEVCVTGRMIKPLEMEQRCNTLEAECAKQAEELNRKNNECQSLMDKNAEYSQTKQSLLQKQQDLNNQLAQLTESIESKKQNNANKQAQCDSLRKKKREYNDKISKKQADIEKKRLEREQESKKLKEAQNDEENLKNEVYEKREDLSYKAEDQQNYSKSSNTSTLKEPLLTSP